MAPIKAVVFDLDGLLINSEPLWHRAEIEVFRAVGVPLTPEMCLETTGQRVDAVVRHWRARYPWQGHDDVEQRLVARVADIIAAEVTPMPHAKESVTAVHERGLKVGLASSSPMIIIEAALARLGLRDHFSTVRSAELLAHGKPHPEVYLLACNDLGVAPADAMAVEDSSSGIRAAHAAGMRVVCVPDPSTRRPDALPLAHHVLADLSELSALL
jgi:mannitol-1-/sugar-/sorbitol-6-/2-deoxyglucose-6-phosphatase